MISSLHIPARVVLVGLLFSVVILAFGYRTEATGFTFASGDYWLKIDSHAVWNGVVQLGSTWTSPKKLNPTSDKFFNLYDVKPGDTGEATISLHPNKDSWICLDFEHLTQKENGRNEPEMQADNSGGATQGELADGTEFFAWYDDGAPHPGDNIFQVGEKAIFGTTTGNQAATKVLNQKTYALADSIAGQAYPANQTKYIGITWCAGDLKVNVATAVITCDGAALGNAAQTDSFSVDISFRATPKADQPHFSCKKDTTSCIWPGPVNINVTNNGTIINNTTSNSNTGGNSAGGSTGGSGGSGGSSGGTGGSGGTVTTGSASSTATTTNILNTLLLRIGGR